MSKKFLFFYLFIMRSMGALWFVLACMVPLVDQRYSYVPLRNLRYCSLETVEIPVDNLIVHKLLFDLSCCDCQVHNTLVLHVDWLLVIDNPNCLISIHSTTNSYRYFGTSYLHYYCTGFGTYLLSNKKWKYIKLNLRTLFGTWIPNMSI